MVNSEQFNNLDYYGALLREQAIEKHYNELYKLQYNVLYNAQTDEMSELEDNFEGIEERYYEAVAALRKKVSELNPHLQLAGATAASKPDERSTSINYNIPNIWGEFDGSYLKWKGYRDLFLNAVHNNTDIPKSYKFALLQKSLVGRAAKTLGDWRVSAANYDEAWERLNQLYDRSDLIAAEHLRRFYRLPVLNFPANANELQRMSDVTHETFRQLRALELPVEHWDFVFVHGLTERLDHETGRQWQLQQTANTWPKLQELLEFLDKHAAAMTTGSGRRQTYSSVAGNNQPAIAGPSTSTGAIRKTGAGAAGSKGTSVQQKLICELCSRNHPLFYCSEFLDLGYYAQLDFLKRRKLCENCFEKGHRKEQCTKITCPRSECARDPFHNSVICPTKRGIHQAMATMGHDQNNLHSKRPSSA